MYSKIAESPDFKSGLERLLNGIENGCLMCSRRRIRRSTEGFWSDEYSVCAGVEVLHIRADGQSTVRGAYPR